MKSKRAAALKIAKKTRTQFSEEDVSLPTMLRDCTTICRYLGISDANKWIEHELKGYLTDKLKKTGEENIIPEYRHVREVFYDEYNRPAKGDFFTAFPATKIVMPIERVMCWETDGAITRDSHQINLLNGKKLRVEFGLQNAARIEYSKISPDAVTEIINNVKNRTCAFLDELILELEYGKMPENIFEEIRQEVDEKFMQLCPNAIKKLVVIYPQLDNNEDVIYSQIASTCRQVVKDVADALYPVQLDDKGKNKNPELSDDKYLKRLYDGIQSTNEKKLFKSMDKYVYEFLRSLNSYASKGDHSEFKKSDAKRCVIYTYILLGDILHYYGKDNTMNKTSI